MKTSIVFTLALFIVNTSSVFSQTQGGDYVNVSNVTYGGNEFTSVIMTRQNDRIKAKYFAAKNSDGSVYERFQKWARGRKIVLATSGTYMDECEAYRDPKPVGLTVDNGVSVNKDYVSKLGGLVIVYATGGVVASKIDERNLTMNCGNGNKVLNIQDSWSRTTFMSCAESVAATAFQAHLLVWKNKLNVSKVDFNERERRFLAVGTDGSGNTLHVITHVPGNVTLYDGTKMVFDFLQGYVEMKEVIFLVNLDTGCQDVFQLYDQNGNIRTDIKGKESASQAANLLVYYYE